MTSVKSSSATKASGGLLARLFGQKPKPPAVPTGPVIIGAPSVKINEIMMAPEAGPSGRRLAKAKSVLIVANEDNTSRKWKREIEEWGYSVSLCGDSEAGLDKLFDIGYDALLLDFSGPKINGLAALEELRAEETFKNLFVAVFVCDKAESADEETAAINAGANRAFRRAEVTSEQILTALKTALFPRVFQVQPRGRKADALRPPPARPNRVIPAPSLGLEAAPPAPPAPVPPASIPMPPPEETKGPQGSKLKKVLIIEDDETVAGFYRAQIEAAGFEVEVALDGATGFHDLHTIAPNALLLDLFLPGLSGLEIIRKTHVQKKFEKLPILALTSGYSRELEADAREAGATRLFDKVTCTTSDIINALNELFFPEDTARNSKAPRDSSSPVAAIRMSPPPPAVNDDALKAEIREALLQDAPEIVKALRHCLSSFIRCGQGDPEGRAQHLTELHRRIHALIGNAAISGFTKVARLSGALDGMLREFQDRPETINASSQRTLTQAIDFLALLFTRSGKAEVEPGGTEQILVVDDEIISRRVIGHSLEKANLKPAAVDHPEAALALLQKQSFDLIFLDVEMPVMSGFDLCKKLRNLPQHAKTPVIFVTALNGFDSRVKSSLSGGDDFIGKPFSYIELAVKALIYVLRGRSSGPGSAPSSASQPLQAPIAVVA